MFRVSFPPTLLAGENRGYTRCVNNPPRTNTPGAVAVAKRYRLFLSRPQLHIDYRCGTQNLRARNNGAAQHLFIKRCAIQLIGRDTYLIKRPDLARLRERLYFAVCKPKPQSLLGHMRLVEVLRQPQHTAYEICADFHGCFADAP